MEFSRPEYWSALPCPPSGDLPNPGIEPRSPALLADSLPSEPPGKPFHLLAIGNNAAMNMNVYTNICLSPGSALLHMYSEEGLQHNGHSMFSLDPPCLSHRSCTVLHSHQQCASLPMFLHPITCYFWCEMISHCGFFFFLRDIVF